MSRFTREGVLPRGRWEALLVAAVLGAAGLPGGALADADDKPARPQVAEESTLETRLGALEPGPGLPEGALLSARYLLETADRIERGFGAQARSWRGQAADVIASLEKGEDPYPAQRGRIVQRGYRSPVSTRLQGYTLYLPPGYDPAVPAPLVVVLHGGSSNGNLYLGVVLGNNMNWKEYDQHLWDDYTPRWSPDCIVVAPDGFGQVMWRFMGERDVLDVVADVQRHYAVDPDRIALSGLSNGGVGAYAIAARQGDRFSTVQAIAGAPSWVLYAGEHTVHPPEQVLIESYSALSLLPNLEATHFEYHHGHTDPGPMKPRYVERFDRAVAEAGVEVEGHWYDAGHDLLYRVLRHGRRLSTLASVERDPSPAKVHLRTGDLRAAHQHWVQLTGFQQSGAMAELEATVEGERVTLRADNVASLAFDLRTLPATGETLVVAEGERVLLSAPRAELGSRLHLVSRDGKLQPGFPEAGPRKRPGLSGPITDAYWTRMVHVYGTQNEAHTEALRRSAERGAAGWPKWLWGVEQEVVADGDVDAALAGRATLVLYGTPGDNAWLERVASKLPIQVDAQGVRVGDRRVDGPDVGTRFIYPNPEAPDRYLIVQAGTSPRAVDRGHNLPDFVPDFVVYDAASSRRRPRLLPGRPAPPVRGHFDAQWGLPVSGRAAP